MGSCPVAALVRMVVTLCIILGGLAADLRGWNDAGPGTMPGHAPKPRRIPSGCEVQLQEKDAEEDFVILDHAWDFSDGPII